jgi:hypothetical protein
MIALLVSYTMLGKNKQKTSSLTIPDVSGLRLHAG